MGNKRTPALGSQEAKELLSTLQVRFESNLHRHPDIPWSEVVGRLEARPEKLRTLAEMEQTGGEPDVVGRDGGSGEVLFFDCSPESPAGRRSLCYDGEAREARKKHKPEGSALDLAAAMGCVVLDEEQYRRLQALGPVDTKTSSWLRTPADIRHLGGALFGDYRYGTVFVYHNGAESYYAARGFRGAVSV